MEFDCPDVIRNMKDMQAVYGMNDRINPLGDAESLEKDLFVGTATLGGIRRREKLYDITPKDTESLEERRYRLLAKENNRVPYTARALKRKLATLCGEDGYCMLLDDTKLDVKVRLARKSMFGDVEKLLEDMAPCNLVLEAGLLYNRHSTLGRLTHKQLAAYTHLQLREDVMD